MSIVNMLQAKTQLSKLVEAVESGAEEEIIIARNGKPAARLVPLARTKKKIRLGLAEGKYPSFTWEEWKQSDEELVQMFEKAAARKDALWEKWEQEPYPEDEDKDAPPA
jgi:prevent-host-death family protein